MKKKIKDCVMMCRESDTKMRVFEDQFKSITSEFENVKNEQSQTDRYLALFQPI